MVAKEKKHITEAIRRFVRDCKRDNRLEFRTHQVPGVHVNTIDARVARYGMVPHRNEPCAQEGKFYWYFKVEELSKAVGE